MNKELNAFMEAHDNPNASDGAWQAMLEDAVVMYNEQNGTDYDPFDSWMEYIQGSRI